MSLGWSYVFGLCDYSVSNLVLVSTYVSVFMLSIKKINKKKNTCIFLIGWCIGKSTLIKHGVQSSLEHGEFWIFEALLQKNTFYLPFTQ